MEEKITDTEEDFIFNQDDSNFNNEKVDYKNKKKELFKSFRLILKEIYKTEKKMSTKSKKSKTIFKELVEDNIIDDKIISHFLTIINFLNNKSVDDNNLLNESQNCLKEISNWYKK